MCSRSRPPNLRDGSAGVKPTEGGSGGDPPSVGAARGSAQTTRSIHAREPCAAAGEPDSALCSPRTPAGLDVFRRRSIFRFPRRSSSGYFSFDGDAAPSSPLSPNPVTADKATQTPSPTGQVMNHALQRMAVEQGGGPGTHRLHGSNPSSTRVQNASRDMQAETFGRQLRTIGDEYNRLLLLRRIGRPRREIVHLNLMPHIHQEPVAMLCVSLLLLLIGRLIYLQGCTNSQNNSQV
ncbi:bcl-2-like protein 11 [Austrofundulus limnaeus]|uniref:Bcl-2-like protein 11 n=1 Tax=Austrofundulus limnaeus TaxID=52670 RepID=A0A2I4AYQ4_AUSLI|nr:PREDICTED: bcl-2-like protein 11 [Austrofundulus limnaeus]